MDGILEKRAPHREGHLAHANSCNELVAGGAHKDAKTDAVTGGLLMFKAADTSVVEKFATIFPRGVVVIWYWNWYWFLKVYADAPIQRRPYPYQKYFWKVERDE